MDYSMNENGQKRGNLIMVVALSLLVVAVIVLIVLNVVFAISNNKELSSECLRIKEDIEAMDCLNEEAFSYYDDNNCVEALKVYEGIPENRFNSDLLSRLYGRAYQMSLSCDEDLQSYWKEKFDEVSKLVEART